MEGYDYLYKEVDGVKRKHLLGSGGSGRVYLMKRRVDGRKVAVKFVPWKDRSVANAALKEGQTLLNTKCENVLEYLGVFLHYDEATGEDVVCIISKYCDNGSLSDLMTPNVPQVIPESKIGKLKLFRQIAEGLVFLHEQNIIHRYLKPANIFIMTGQKSQGELSTKIGDIGLGTTVQPQR